MLRCARVVFLLLLTSLVLPFSYALAQDAGPWLSSAQQGDGGIYGDDDVALPAQSSAEAREALSLAGELADVDQSLLEDFFSEPAYASTEFYAITLLSGRNVYKGESLSQLIIDRQNQDGGFGDFENFQSTVYDTYWAVRALELSGQLPAGVKRNAIHFLLNQQDESGGWAFGKRPSVFLSSRIVTLVSLYTREFVEIPSAIGRANDFIDREESKLSTDSATFFSKCAALSALSVVPGHSAAPRLAGQIDGEQANDGAWADGDVFTTAMCLKAQLQYRASLGEGQPLSGVTGRLLEQVTGQPVGNVSVIARQGEIATELSTNAEGFFSASNLSAGTLNLTFSKPGYVTTYRTLEISSTDQALGEIYLPLEASQGIVRGVVYSSTTGAPVNGASITRDGQSVLSDQAGRFQLTGVEPGQHQINVVSDGYYDFSSTVDVNGGESLELHIELIDQSAVLDDSPGTLSGSVVDGDSGQPIGATLTLSSGDTALANADGTFSFEEVTRGSYDVSLSAAGYGPRTYTFEFTPGSSGNLGSLLMYPPPEDEGQESLTLEIYVRDALSGEPLSGAEVTSSPGSTLTADSAGRVVLEGIVGGNFSIQASHDGYLTAQKNYQYSGTGAVSTEILLTPETEAAADTTLSGTVHDGDGNPVANATVTVSGIATVISDANGEYQLSGIDSLAFTLEASSPGYHTTTIPLEIQAHGAYQLDIRLETVEPGQWNISSISVPNGIGLDQQVEFDATIQNMTTTDQNVLVTGTVIDENGDAQSTLTTLLPGTSEPVGSLDFGANQSRTIPLRFDVAATPAGSYQLLVQVIEEGSVTSAFPSGVVLSRQYKSFSIEPTTAFGGDLNITPPLIQAGSENPISLDVVARNAGNVELEEGVYELRIANEQGEVFHRVEKLFPTIPAGKVVNLDFGTWTVTEAGHLSVTVMRQDAPDIGEISGIYYVGDIATATFEVDQSILPEGDSNTRGTIDVRGVDVTRGSSTDPLYVQAIDAVERGAEYTSDATIYWHKRHRCLGCHVQTQSLAGVGATIGRANLDRDKATTQFNFVASSQQPNGELYMSHYYWSVEQSELGAWALSYWPDKQDSYKPLYRAMEYLWSKRGTGSDFIYWTDQHRHRGWITVRHQASTAIVAKAMVDLIRTNKNLPESEYNVAVAEDRFTLNGSFSSPHYLEKGSNGTLLIAKRGAIERFDPQTGLSEIIFSDPANRDIYQAVEDADGTIFAVAHQAVIKIDSDGNSEEMPLGSGLRGITFWQGNIFVADYSGKRIWRVDRNLEASVFVSGGLLVAPVGMEVSPDNTLIVANYTGRNVLEVTTGKEVSVYLDGFAYRPKNIVAGDDPHEYLVLAEYNYVRDKTTYPQIQRISPRKTIERLNLGQFSNRLTGVELVGDKIYSAINRSNDLQAFRLQEIDHSLIETLESNLPKVANYLLRSHTDNTNEILRIAFRMVGVGEIRAITDDPVLRDTYDNAMLVMEQYLRDRQNNDGGWGRYRDWGSDPLITAWVGMALDYQNPSADDPVVRNAITYLLNTQSGNGSWYSNQIYKQNPRPSTTSMVMAYMPRALDRLGGLDVEVGLEMPADVLLSAPSITPDLEEPLDNGGAAYRWSLTGVTGEGQSLAMDLGIQDLLLHELRPVADSAKLYFKNSFTDETIVHDIAIPSVSAGELLADIGTDRNSYYANDRVNIASSISNLGSTLDGLVARVGIKTQAGEPIAEVSSRSLPELNVDETRSLDDVWSTDNTPTGTYMAELTVSDQSGDVLGTATDLFHILPSTGDSGVSTSYEAEIATDKTSYLPYEVASLTSRVLNVTVNSSQSPVLAKVRVNGPEGNVFGRNIVIPEMSASAILDYPDSLALTDASPGTYRATIELWDAAGTSLLASDSTSFAVVDEPSAHLLGDVTATKGTVHRGKPVDCTFAAENRSSSSTVSPKLYYELVTVENETVLNSVTDSQSLAPGQTHTHVEGIATGTLETGDYACLLRAELDGTETTLGYAGFSVIPPKVNVETAFGNRGRVLVLLDDPAGPGPGEQSGLSDQDSYLRSLLDQAGYSYTIVYNRDDFELEFLTGHYNSYALFSEQVNLLPELQQLVGEAAYKGDGLLIGGALNRRNNHLEAALGIESTGREQKADGVLIPAGALGEEWPETVVNPAVKLDFNRCGARVLAVYLNPKKGGKPVGPGCYEDEDIDIAAGGHNFGEGYSVYVGFDALDEAASSEEGNAYGSLLLHSLDLGQPEPFEPEGPHPRVGDNIPVDFSLSTEDQALDVRVTATVPAELQMLDTVPGFELIDEEQHVYQWQDHMDVQSEQVLSLHLKALSAGAIAIPVTIEASEGDGEWYLVTEFDHDITVESAPDYLTQAQPPLQALASLIRVKDSRKIDRTYQTALAARDGGDTLTAVSELLKAVELLADIPLDEARDARLLLDRALFSLLYQL